jgi:hypothetical protein
MQLSLWNESQRWNEGKSRWVKPRHVVDTSTLEAVLIDDDTTARDFIATHHYSGSYPAARARVGLYQHGRLVGCAVFSMPMNNRVLPKWTGLGADESAELGRFVLLDEVGYNAETWFLKRAFDLVKSHKGWRAIMAYSDPMMRHTHDGKVILPGHVGTIYKAHNALYLGRSASRTHCITPDGRVISPRMLSKFRNDESGADAARVALEQLGAPEYGGGNRVDYIKHALATIGARKFKHPGNHCYVWSLDKKHRIDGGLSYPTSIEQPEYVPYNNVA